MYIYVPQISYPFICQWTSRLLPCPGYCKQCCDEHWGTRVSFNSDFLGVYAHQWDCWVVWQFYREGNGTPLQYSFLENPMDGGAWEAAVHGVATSWTRLSNFTFTFHFLALEKEMATHSIVLAWRIPRTGEPSGLPSMGSQRVRHN